MKVDDSTNHPEGFKDGNGGNDYAYDDFGNLVQDLNKGIYKSGNKGITYNHLNLPKEITFQNNPNKKITYLYNALGQKLEKKVTNGSTIITTDYQGGFQYEDEVLRFFATSEGYVSYDEQSESFTYIYNYTDHLGNVRLSYKAGAREEDPPAIVDENHYYPFGLKHTNYGFVPQQELAYAQKFNHREWQDEFNLNLTAMDFRQYDNALGRFYNPDRLAELAPGITPYRFAFNNPNYWSDPTGLFESWAAAISYALTNNISGDILFSGGENGFYYISTGSGLDAQNIAMFGGELSIVGTIIETVAVNTGGGGGSGFASSGSVYGGNGGGNSNPLGIGFSWANTSFLRSGYTFFGAPIRFIPYDFEASSYFAGAINIHKSTWEAYLKGGLDSWAGRHLMHEYGHYLQEKYGGTLNYYGIVVPQSLGTINKTSEIHASNPVEIQASTLAYYYFGMPDGFKTYNNVDILSIRFNHIKIPTSILYEIQNGYLNHPNYRP